MLVINGSRSGPAMSGSDGLLIGGIAAVGVTAAGLWVGGQAASLATGNGWANGSPVAGVTAALSFRDNPAAAWDSPMPAPAVYWSISIGTVAFLVTMVVVVAVRIRVRGRDR